MTTINSFKDLRIWQLGMDIVTSVYSITRSFPKDELYGLTSQMRRCSVSIPSNIAEGFLRKHDKEYHQFLRIALGSSGELETQVEIACKLELLNTKTRDELLEQIDHTRRMILNLIKKLNIVV